ncbi:MAG TPA: class I SAM-dependent methyltransferase [Pseudonocardiaceae bacterium]|nr:class I SAM-dependent methyltransferase [Pseudonocardiaceae bacterium]
MTEQGRLAAEPWLDADFAGKWASNDVNAELLAFPRAIAAALVAADRPGTTRILDVASGPGDFLAVFLDEFPHATGVWTDVSAAMLDLARDRLARFGDRVEFQLLDMTDLASGTLPTDIDVVVTSRAAHHLDKAGLGAFYAAAARLLAPGGWLLNLDHIGPETDDWDRRLRAVRKRFQQEAPKTPQHHHNYPLTSVRDHMAAFDGAGLVDVEVVWRAFVTCLFAARATR